MASMELQFSDVYTKVSEFLGLGSSPTGTDLTLVKDIVYRGYRKFLFPLDLQNSKLHDWSFLSKYRQIVTEDAKNTYILPAEYAGSDIWMEYDEDSVYPTPAKVSYKEIVRRKNSDNYSGYPTMFAVKNGEFDKVVGQRYEVVFFPTPNAAYNLPYGFRFIPDKPTNDTDYFVGGIKANEAILECCLSVAELQEDDTIGIHAQEAERLVQQLIKADKPLCPDTVGMMVANRSGYPQQYVVRYSPAVASGNIYSS